MVTIAPVSLEVALASRTHEPSSRTLRTRSITEDAKAVLTAISEQGAASIQYGEEEDPIAGRYLSGLRAAMRRLNHPEVLFYKQRSKREIRAWVARPEDQTRIESRRATGQRLGQHARERAATRAKVQAQAEEVLSRATGHEGRKANRRPRQRAL